MKLLQVCIPSAARSQVSPRVKARIRALLGIEPWPDLAVRHPLFREPEYRTLREAARLFDIEKPNKPVLERGHQTSYVLARWFTQAGVRTAFHVGYASGRHLFYLSRRGLTCGGTDLPAGDTAWVQVPNGALDEATRRRMLRVDFFHLEPEHLRSSWPDLEGGPVDVLFSEATFETLLPWRATGLSVPGYLALGAETLHRLMHQDLPQKLEALQSCVRSMAFIEPEPAAGNTGAVFDACARRLPSMTYTVWRFRPPFDTLFRLSPGQPTQQTVYVFARDERLTEALRQYAEPR
jgi:hypothetical protein